MRLAVPIWENKVSPVLDTARNLLVLETGVAQLSSRFEIHPVELSLYRRCALIRDLEIEVIICGAVSRQFAVMLTASGIQMVSGISGPVGKVVEAYFDGSLAASGLFLPGQKKNPKIPCISAPGDGRVR